MLEFHGSGSSSELPKLLADGRTPSMLRGGRDLAVFGVLCRYRNRTKAVSYFKMLQIYQQTLRYREVLCRMDNG